MWNAYARALGLKKKKEKKEKRKREKKGKKKKRKKKQNWGLFRTHGIWSFLGERSLIWEPGRRKVEMF